MDEDGFKKLDMEVSRAVSLIAKLKMERESLTARLSECEVEIEKLRDENRGLQNFKRKNIAFLEGKEKLKSQIEDIIKKIDSVKL